MPTSVPSRVHVALPSLVYSTYTTISSPLDIVATCSSPVSVAASAGRALVSVAPG